VQPNQLTAMLQALRTGTPNRNHIALQMVKDVVVAEFHNMGVYPGDKKIGDNASH
jgi:hypothetical protein